MKICNILYPHSKARDDEISRLDGVMLHVGTAFINGVGYYLTSFGPPEYVMKDDRQECSSVTYRWLVQLNP